LEVFAMPVSYGAVIDPSDQSLLLREPDTSKAYVLDTNVLIDVAGGKPLGITDDNTILVSALSLVELAAPHHMDLSEAESFIRDVTRGDVLPITRETACIAVELREIHSLTVIDACIAATACVMDATLVTNDRQMRRHPVLTSESFPLNVTEEKSQ
jgi:predicted nucleic acid-binding protein